MATLLPRSTKFAVGLTYAGLWAERVALSCWPLFSLILCAMGTLLLGSLDLWPIEVIWLSFSAAACLGLWCLWHIWAFFSWPSLGQARARLDQSLPGRPLTALQDVQAIGRDDPESAALWDAHLALMHHKAAMAKAVGPDVQLARQDPYALRYMALLIFFVGMVFGTSYKLSDGPRAPTGTVILGPSWEVWMQPPAYANRPTLYLNDVIGQRLSVPQDSLIIVRLYSDDSKHVVDEAVSGRVENPLDAADQNQQFLVTQSGGLAILGLDEARWDLDMIVDLPPKVEVVGEIKRESGGTFGLTFSASDDFGVTSGRVWVRLNLAEVDRRHGLAAVPASQLDIELALPLTTSGDRSNFTEVFIEDLSKHLWAHLPVSFVLEVEDIRGQIGRSASLEIELPALRFFDPLAKALTEQRRDLLWSNSNRRRVAQILRAISQKPEPIFRDFEDGLALTKIISQLEEGKTREDLGSSAELLWLLALEVEDGDLDQAAEKLARAQDKLAEAIKNGATREEITRLMEELRQAQREYFKEFAERNPAVEQPERPPTADDNVISENQLQEMMDRLQQLMEEGRMAEAQELLEEINRLIQNLQTSKGQDGGEGQEGQDGGQQQMEDLADSLRQQQRLSDQTFRELQNPGQGQDGGAGEGVEPTEDDGSLAGPQKKLQWDLNRQRGKLPGAGTEPGQEARRSLDEAGRAMERAAEDLETGNLPGALDNQSEVIDALRDGMSSLSETLAEQQPQGQGATPNGRISEGESQNLTTRDPLGRDAGNNGQLGAGEQMVPQQELRLRSQELMDEIRRRSGALDRPKEERGYLQRLLDRF
ncbi:MAG TPA: ATPase [Rhodobacteraceae bacterium]|nr:ATPase [Paracoccaceae bacterium]